jgi:hypothetical protein
MRLRTVMMASARSKKAQLFEDDPVADPRLVAPQRVRRVIDGTVGQQHGELVPQRFQQP